MATLSVATITSPIANAATVTQAAVNATTITTPILTAATVTLATVSAEAAHAVTGSKATFVKQL